MGLEANIDFMKANPVLLRRMFSSRVLKDLGNNKVPAELLNVLSSLGNAGQLKEGVPLSSLYNSAFKHCFRHQRVEYFYKNALVEKLVIGRRSLKTTTAYVEVRIAEAKLDVLLAGKYLSAYEIKTDFDELARLPAQIKAYQRACREVTVLTGERFASAVEASIPPEVGLSVLTNRYQLRVLRSATPWDRGLVNSDMLSLLRRHELLRLLKDVGKDASGIPNTRIFQCAVQAATDLSPVAINAFVASRLLERSAAKRGLVEGLPMSLAASALAQDLTRTQMERLIEIFETDVSGGARGDLLSLFQGEAV
ncbi:sce7726 family protein [Xanthomonas arboricola]|uniref:sce7726 family protein n=1 Tax=Xanthomonas arboricola TaxID=56448 RepID=UPI0012906706|nr:sce7726 family protein [Xanthomonas arboricola]